ncbi:hypothetical protein BH10BAC3_BH10BAC3_21710 [soil metagenome]
MTDLAQILSDKIEKSQTILANWRDPQNRLSDEEVLKQLNNILDNSVLSALKEMAGVRDMLATHGKAD